ncbi:hypothetical protein PR001_g10977 [Phytophthora rubi]|uniref:OTU domain-containing protein n=1 Tax=Phytophthora rubi TaxID=129364 RepID=A0A6A3MQV3_9STRA|nr:hypothetical protein PR001_g10977 [Phytophthora rubi]
MTAPPASGRLSSRFSLRSSAKTSSGSSSRARRDQTESRVEYGPPRCDVQERDASWTSNEQVEAHYAALGWAVVPICKDGNCLFRAVSDQLYTNELFHQDIRRRLVDFIESDEKLFKPFIEDEDVADYCARLRENGQLRVTNEDDGDAEKQQPPYRTLHLLFKDDHYSSLHSNEEVTTVTPEEDAVVSSDKRPRSPTKVYDSPDKKSGKYQVALTKAVKFQEVVEAKSPQREGHTCIYAEENVPECGVFLPKQVLFRRGKRRVSGATLFSLVHVPSTSNLLPVMESPSTSESSSSSTASTTSETSSSSEEQEERSDTKPPVPPRPKATASTLRAVPVEYPSKAVFRKGRATAAAC